MKFKDLIDDCDIEKVRTHLAKECFDLSDVDIENHIKCLHRIKNIKPRKTKYTDLVIVVKEVDEDDFIYYDVTGYDVNNTLYFEDDNVPYTGFWALEFRKWNEWLSMEVHETTLAMFDHNFIVAACLWEMTFIDYNEDSIQNRWNEIEDRVDEFRKDLEE